MKTSDRKPSGACPTYFRATCREASEGGPGHSYRHAGYSLAGGLHQLAPHDMEDDQWHERLEALADLITPPDRPNGFTRPADDAPVLAWFLRELPRCMTLVPARRRSQFLEGVYRFVIDEENDVTNL